MFQASVLYKRDPESAPGVLDHGPFRTFGVCDLTLPARARDPWTLPMIAAYDRGAGGNLVPLLRSFLGLGL